MTPDERAFLEKFRTMHEDASTDIRERIVGDDHFLEGRLIPEVEHTPIAAFDAHADYRDIAYFVQVRRAVDILFRARDAAVAYYRSQNPAPEQQQDAKPYSPAQNCGKWCGDMLFQKYMFEVHGLENPGDRNRMATKMHSLLGVNSRALLDRDELAAGRWHDLRSEFNAWKGARL